MQRGLLAAAVAALVAAGPVSAAAVTGKYIEARTCDVWVAPCFANAEMNLAGKHAIMGWKVDHGTLDGVRLDGLGVVAVVAASDTLGLQQTGRSKAVVIVDEKADAAQRAALVKLAKRQGGDLVRNVIDVRSAPIALEACPCPGNACAKLKAGSLAHIETRCINKKHDKSCGNESAFYPPLAKVTHAEPAVAVEHGYRGAGLNATWRESERRGAYFGCFEMN